MLKIVWMCTLLWSSTAIGDVDKVFANGVPRVEWGTTLQELQTIYPNGVTWDAGVDTSESYRVYYSVPGDTDMLGIDVPVQLVQFCFSKDFKLQAVFFNFNYADREAVLYRVAEALGQDYSVEDKVGTRKLRWKQGRKSIAAMRIGIAPPYTWANLGVMTVEVPPASLK